VVLEETETQWLSRSRWSIEGLGGKNGSNFYIVSLHVSNASKQKLMHLSRKNNERLVSVDKSQNWLMSFRILRQAAQFMCLSTSPAIAWPNPYAASLTPVKLQAG